MAKVVIENSMRSRRMAGHQNLLWRQIVEHVACIVHEGAILEQKMELALPTASGSGVE